MAEFDYAFDGVSGRTSVSASRLKSAVLGGELQPHHRIYVIRHAPPETRRLSPDELRAHFELLGRGVEDPFAVMDSEVVAETGAAPRPSPPPARRHDDDPDRAYARRHGLDPTPPPTRPPPPPRQAREPALPEEPPPPPPPTGRRSAEERVALARAALTSASPEWGPGYGAAPLRGAARATEAPSRERPRPPAGRRRDEGAERSDPPRRPDMGRAPQRPASRPPPRAPEAEPPRRHSVYEPETAEPMADRAAGRRLPLLALVGGLIAVVGTGAIAMLVMSGPPERVTQAYAFDATVVHDAPSGNAGAVTTLQAGQPVTVVVSGGDAPPPSGWARVMEPADVAGGFVAADRLSPTPLEETRARAYARRNVEILAAPASGSEVLGALRVGDRMEVVTGGGEAPPPAGWARVATPRALAGGYAPAAALSDAPLPPVIETRYARRRAAGHAGPSALADVVRALDSGSAVTLRVRGGAEPPPPGWAVIVAPPSVSGLFVELSDFGEAGPGGVVAARYAAADTRLVAAPDAADGVLVKRGGALSVVTTGGDDPPPLGWARVIEPEAYAGLLARLDALAAEAPPPITRRVYVAAPRAASAALPAALQVGGLESPVDAPSRVQLSGGEALEVVVSGGEAAPPAGWLWIAAPTRARGRWIEEDAVRAEPPPEQVAERYAHGAVDLLDAPRPDAPAAATLSAGDRVTLVVSGGPNPPPPGWARVAAPDAHAGAFVRPDALETRPPADETRTVYALGAVDVFANPDSAAPVVGGLQRGQSAILDQAGLAEAAGWARLARPATGYVRRSGLAAEPRPPLAYPINEEWRLAADVVAWSEPTFESAVVARFAAGDRAFVIGAIDAAWLEVRSALGQIGYAPRRAFATPGAASAGSAATPGAATATPAADTTWWATQDVVVRRLPSAAAPVVTSLSVGDPALVRARVDAMWIGVTVGDANGYAPASAFSPSPPAVITPPSLVAPPTARAVSRAFPRDAIEDDVEGDAVLECVIGLDGGAACAITSENPEGYGFGAAALELAKDLQFTPRMRNGAPEAGGRIALPIRFALTDD